MKKIKRTIPFSALALTFSLVAGGTAQAEWIKTYGTANIEFGSATPSSQGSYYLSMSSTPLASNSKSATLLSLLNTNGKPLWTKKISSGAYDYFFLGELSNGRLLLQGSRKLSATGTNNDPVWAIYNVNRTTGALSPVFSKTYKGKGDDQFFIIPDSSGALWGTGTTTSFSQDGKGTDMIVAKINANTGAPDWSKVFHYDYKDSVANFIPKGNQFILAANAQDVSGGSQKILIGLLNNLGAPVAGSFKKYGGAGINSAIAIKPIANGNYLVYGTNRTGIKDTNTTLFVAKLNSNLGYIWGKKYAAGADQGLTISDINENANGSLALTSNLMTPIYFDQGGFHIPVGTAQHPAVIQLSATGAVTSSKSFEYQEVDSANFSKKTDGTYLLGGSTMPFNLSGGGSLGNIDALYGHFSAGFVPDWIKTLGGSKFDFGVISQQATGYTLFGATGSWGVGNQDALVGKLDANGDVPGCPHINEVTMTETAPKISASNLNWQAQAATLATKGGITNTNIALAVTNATIKVTNVCSH